MMNVEKIIIKYVIDNKNYRNNAIDTGNNTSCNGKIIEVVLIKVVVIII